jgi:hypothetical protein
MGVDFKGKGPIPMFADGKVVRVVRSKSGWPGEGGLIVVQRPPRGSTSGERSTPGWRRACDGKGSVVR